MISLKHLNRLGCLINCPYHYRFLTISRWHTLQLQLGFGTSRWEVKLILLRDLLSLLYILKINSSIIQRVIQFLLSLLPSCSYISTFCISYCEHLFGLSFG